jgi:hypothetical protein
MRLPILDPDAAGNAHLHDLLDRLHPADIPAFVEKLTTQPLRAKFHTYRELLVGAHIRDQGFNVRYEQDVYEKTPDWSLFSEDEKLLEVIDVVTLHQRNEKEREINNSIRCTNMWTGWITIPPEHIYRKLDDKAGQYASLADQALIPYVVALYGEFIASLSPEEIAYVLNAYEGGWFKTRPEVAGVIYFREHLFRFEFTCFSNPFALCKSAILQAQSGSVPL